MVDSPYRERRYSADEAHAIVTQALGRRPRSRTELERVLDALEVEPTARARLLVDYRMSTGVPRQRSKVS